MSSNAPDLTSLADRISRLARQLKATQEDGRLTLSRTLVEQSKQLIHLVQDPFDSIVDQATQGYTIGSTLTLLKLGVFDLVPETGSITLDRLAQQCNIEAHLLRRLMRMLTCVGIFEEVKSEEWTHNKLSGPLSRHKSLAGQQLAGRPFYEVVFEEMLPSMLSLHKYISQYGNLKPGYLETPHAWYNNMLGKTFWEILSTDKKRLDTFNTCLEFYSCMHPVVAMFPFTEVLSEFNSPSRTLLVDVGGGYGQAIKAFRRGCPELQGECVLQDRPEVIASITDEDLPGVTRMAHDFFQPQPVKNAQVYYIRRVMHDWMNEEAMLILRQITPVMAADSRILIADMCLPKRPTVQDAGAVWLDLMMIALGGKERTEEDWNQLAELSGLKLVKIWQETDIHGPLCVVEYMLPERRGEGRHVDASTMPLVTASDVQEANHDMPRGSGLPNKNAITCYKMSL